MAWSEAAFKERIAARAKQLGISLTQLLAKAGLAHDILDKKPASGRRVDTLEKLADACNWSLAEVMGLDVFGRISQELLKKAFTSAQRVLSRLPQGAQTEDHLIAAQAYIYDALDARRRDGRRIDDATLEAYEEMLIRAWEGKDIFAKDC